VFWIFRCRTFFVCFGRSLQKRKIESSLYIFNENDDVTRKVHTLEQMKDEKLASDMSEEEVEKEEEG
jgi:hypothetical protein